MTMRVWNYLKSKHGFEKGIFLILIIQTITSGMGWVQYSIRFQDVEETVFISVPWNIYFILGSLFNLFFVGFWKSRWLWHSFLVIQGVLIVLFGFGSMNPDKYLVSLVSSEDYRFSLYYYLFSLTLGLNFLLGLVIYLEERKNFLSPITRMTPND